MLFRNSGNALFLILIAVALFAALSYAVTQSGRGGGNTAAEQAQLQAARVMNFAARVQQAVTRLRLINGCSETQLSFENSNAQTGSYANPGAPTDKSCNVFDPAGGGVAFEDLPGTPVNILPGGEWWTAQYSIFGGFEVYGQGTTGNRPASNDLVLGAPVSLDMCNAINKQLRIATMYVDSSPAYYATQFQGSYANGGGTAVLGDATHANGAFCFKYTPTAVHYFYVQTLIAR